MPDHQCSVKGAKVAARSDASQLPQLLFPQGLPERSDSAPLCFAFLGGRDEFDRPALARAACAPATSTPATLGTAVFNAIGVRRRPVPFTAAQVMAAPRNLKESLCRRIET